MSTPTVIVIQTPQYQQSFSSFFDLFAYHLEELIPFPVSAFFNELPLNPSRDSVRKRLVNRGDISITRTETVNEHELVSLDPRGRDVKSSFEDDNLGTVIINFPSSLQAKSKIENSSLTVEFISRILVELYLGTIPPGIDRFQYLWKVEAIRDKQVVYHFSGRDNPEQSLMVVNSLNKESLDEFTYEFDKAVNALEIYTQNKRAFVSNEISPRLFLSFLAYYGGCCSLSPCPDDGDGDPTESWIIKRRISDEICFLQRSETTIGENYERIDENSYRSIEQADFARESYRRMGICRKPPVFEPSP